MKKQFHQVKVLVRSTLRHIPLLSKFLSRWGIAAGVLEVERYEYLFYLSYLKEGMTCFDVGANIGRISLIFSRFVGEKGAVHAFEPASSTFKQLSMNQIFNNRPNLVINNLVVTDTVGEVDFYVYDQQNHGWNTLRKSSFEYYGLHVKPVSVEKLTSTTIDDYCTINNIELIDLLKIDVEGSEYQVLLGCQSMLKEKRIRCCIFEFRVTTMGMSNNPDVIESYLKKLGYRLKNAVPYDSVFPGRWRSDPQKAIFSMMIATPL